MADRYNPESVPFTEDTQQLKEWLGREFRSVSNSFEGVKLIELEVLHNEPERPLEGMIKLADGTDWDPGSGMGFYGYFNGAWVKLDNAGDLAAIDALTGTGILVRTGASTWALRSIVESTEGLTITNGDGVAGNPTIGLADDLAAIEALSSTGLAARTAANTWAQRTITGTANEIEVTDGDGVAGSPTIGLTDDVTIPDLLTLGGGQIKFPATQNASSDVNTLDDYEEGTWTPGVTFGGGATGVTYSLQSGVYVKIGRLLYMAGAITLSAKGSSTGVFAFSGIPFFAETSQSHGGVCAFVDNFTGLTQIPVPIITDTLTRLRMLNAGGTSAANLNDTHFTNTSNISFSFTFMVA